MEPWTSTSSRRRLLAGAALAGNAPLSAACGIGQPAGEPPAAALKRADLTFMFAVNAQDFGHDTVVDLFQKAYPQVKVEMVHTPQNYAEKWDSLLAAGTPAEVTQINDDFVPSHGRKGLIRALDGYVTRDKLKKSDFYDLFWSFPAADGKWFAPAVGFRPSLLLVEAMKLGRKSPAAQNADAARRVYRPALEEAYRCQKPVRQVVQEVTSHVNAILGGR